MDYKQLATDILENVGGRTNIKKVNKDYTNLRFVLKNKKLANKEAIEKLEGVKSVQITDTHFNVMIGAKVSEVYKELIGITGEFKEEKEVISNSDIIKAKLSAVSKSALLPFLVLTLLYIASIVFSSSIPETVNKYLQIILMGLWIVFLAYVAQRSGQVFKANTTLTSLLAGVCVGINAYCLNISVILVSLVVIILINILAFNITKSKKK